MTNPICPKCNLELIKEHVDFSAETATWRCSCGYECTIKGGKVVRQKQASGLGDIDWTEEQKDVISFRAGRIAIDATAGSGKSSTLVKRALEKESEKSIFIAFNRDAAYLINEKLGYTFGPQRPKPGVGVTLHQLGWACMRNQGIKALDKKDPKKRGALFEIINKMRDRIKAEFGDKDSSGRRKEDIEKVLTHYMNKCVQTLNPPSADNLPPGKNPDWKYVVLAREFLHTCRDSKITSFDFIDLTFEFALLTIYGVDKIEDLDAAQPKKENLPKHLIGIKNC